jgi:excisionase family DNA binding protein
MMTEMRHRLKQIAQLGQVSLIELSWGVDQESRALAVLSEKRRQAIQELLELIAQLHEEVPVDEGTPQRASEKTRRVNGASMPEGNPFNHQATESAKGMVHLDGETSKLDSPYGNWLTVNQVSSILRVTPPTVRRWIYPGQISHAQLIGRGY